MIMNVVDFEPLPNSFSLLEHLKSAVNTTKQVVHYEEVESLQSTVDSRDKAAIIPTATTLSVTKVILLYSKEMEEGRIPKKKQLLTLQID